MYTPLYYTLLHNTIMSAHIQLLPGDDRSVTFPIQRHDIWDWYIRARNMFWTPPEVDLSEDAKCWETLTTPERNAIEFILAFFAEADGIVNINIAERFLQDMPILEVKYFYDLQATMENIHAETYALQLDTIVPNAQRRKFLLDGARNIPVVARMAAFMRRCIESDEPLPARLLRMACVEGVFFTSNFLIIYWFGTRGKMNGLVTANEFIARDECCHTLFGLHMYSLCTEESRKLVNVRAIVTEAVDIACEFAQAAVLSGIPELNYELMKPYIQNTADVLVSHIGHPPIYGVKHSFDWMEQINLRLRANFFEKRVTNYAKLSVNSTQEIEEDF